MDSSERGRASWLLPGYAQPLAPTPNQPPSWDMHHAGPRAQSLLRALDETARGAWHRASSRPSTATSTRIGRTASQDVVTHRVGRGTHGFSIVLAHLVVARSSESLVATTRLAPPALARLSCSSSATNARPSNRLSALPTRRSTWLCTSVCSQVYVAWTICFSTWPRTRRVVGDPRGSEETDKTQFVGV